MNEGGRGEMTEKTTGNETGIWETVVSLQGRTFYTAKGLPFVYAVKGGELFVDRRKRSVTRSTFERAFEKMRSDPTVRGPKKLGVYGAPYVFAVLKAVMEDMEKPPSAAVGEAEE